MKNSFKQWLDLNRQELVDWYCEGTMVDKDFLTRVEEFAEKAYQAGCGKSFEDGYNSGYNDCLDEYQHRF